jgi:hypothetical protein
MDVVGNVSSVSSVIDRVFEKKAAAKDEVEPNFEQLDFVGIFKACRCLGIQIIFNHSNRKSVAISFLY